ncbi:multidrug effflux MFS transporter [Flavilitoribacter nigricans]|uniref:Bcr/CflA family drug resistance efflux transporter n=1 Tax=Flavilitoribacter nigricans (strain ATCC 23147 / DSM 23189 / NBRC 102662 / NCIMB 1420 / SS-2) TaxID=1122177 RepID=A0A2D0NE91_FLAN2|nr:multidrug effflux MFS transporter [Flavilitoribacter nigricans]PHN06787.1 Bcr/CflA family drug resistance efflux transporter [Flavilitoribacter nigricans DSM 23189 = NBRC 102662]
MNTYQKKERFFLVLILGLLTAMGPLSIDLYLPAFGDIAQSLGTDISSVSLSLSSYFIGLSIGQVIYGPFLERFGRKKPIYIGVLIYIFAALGCAATTSVQGLIVYRFFQALGACGGLVAARAVVRDLFDTREVARVFSMLIMVVAVSPIIAPTLGGYITTHFHWRYVFGLLVVLALLILAGTIILLPESRPPNPAYSMRPASILKNYREVLRNPHFFIFAISGSIAYAGVYAYLSGSPHLYLEIFGVSQSQYGLIFAFVAAGLIGASQVNNLILHRYSSENIIWMALILQSAIAVILLAVYMLDYAGFYTITLLLFAYLCCLGFIFPNASALSLSGLGHTAGNASALLGGIQMVMGALASALVSFFLDQTSIAMFLVLNVCAFSALGLLSFGSRRFAMRLSGS